jgi:hypothetical protein
MSHRRWLWCAIALVVAAAIIRADESLRIVPIVHDDTVLISFELADAYTDGVREAVSSGLRTSFTHDIALRMRIRLGRSNDRDSGRCHDRPFRQSDEASQLVTNG